MRWAARDCADSPALRPRGRYAGIFADGLASGNLMMRVGGHSADSNAAASAYQWCDTPHTAHPRHRAKRRADAMRGAAACWPSGARRFEPALVEGVHYLRAGVDELERALVRTAAAPAAVRERIGAAGQRAARALFTRRSMLCYCVLAIDTYARQQTELLQRAGEAGAGGMWAPLPEGARRGEWFAPEPGSGVPPDWKPLPP